MSAATANRLAGGPADGTDPGDVPNEVLWVNVVHGNCACVWCQEIDEAFVTHIYERCDGGFSYRMSREMRDGD